MVGRGTRTQTWPTRSARSNNWCRNESANHARDFQSLDLQFSAPRLHKVANSFVNKLPRATTGESRVCGPGCSESLRSDRPWNHIEFAGGFALQDVEEGYITGMVGRGTRTPDLATPVGPL